MSPNGRAGQRVPSRTPPFILVGLVVVLSFLGYSYWSLSSSNSDLSAQLEAIRVEKRDMETKNDENQKLLTNLRAQVVSFQAQENDFKSNIEAKASEVHALKIDLSQRATDDEKQKTLLEQCDEKLSVVQKDLESANAEKSNLQQTLDAEREKIPVCTMDLCKDPVHQILEISARLVGSSQMRQALVDAKLDGPKMMEGIDFPAPQQPSQQQQQPPQQQQQQSPQQQQQQQQQSSDQKAVETNKEEKAAAQSETKATETNVGSEEISRAEVMNQSGTQYLNKDNSNFVEEVPVLGSVVKPQTVEMEGLLGQAPEAGLGTEQGRDMEDAIVGDGSEQPEGLKALEKAASAQVDVTTGSPVNQTEVGKSSIGGNVQLLQSRVSEEAAVENADAMLGKNVGPVADFDAEEELEETSPGGGLGTLQDMLRRETQDKYLKFESSMNNGLNRQANSAYNNPKQVGTNELNF